MKKLNIITPLHTSTKRDYLSRMLDDKVHCMKIAKEYGADYWDGDRRYGYGGYKYIPGRWKPVAEALIDKYKLSNESRILDVGCGKGFLLYELSLLLPGAKFIGIDISAYAIENSKDEIKTNLSVQKAQDPYPYENEYFDLVISMNTLHNLEIFDLKAALSEIERVGKNKFIVVESYRNEIELFNLECWALTAESFFSETEWNWIFNCYHYSGDWELIYFN